MIEYADLDLPAYTRVTVNQLSEPLDPYLRVQDVLRVELRNGIRIDAQWDWEPCGYWITAWQYETGVTVELARLWSDDVESLLKVVGRLSRWLDQSVTRHIRHSGTNVRADAGASDDAHALREAII